MGSKRRTAACLLGLILTVSWLACTSTQKADTRSGIVPVAKEACFDVRRADSFSALHERFVYVRLLGNEHYLLTLDSVYTSLPFATGIKLSGEFKFSRVCSDTGAMITFVDFGRPVFCRIVRVEAVASKEAAQQLVKDRTTPKPKE
ncbi:MAG: DUF6491 family protein [Thermoanaerobaculaceae bacterium]|jgi:hypothetical protein